MFVSLDTLLGETKVCNLEVSFAVEENILGLEVSVNDSILMEATYCFDELRGVKTGSLLRKLAVSPQVREKLSSIAEVHHEIELCISLERIVQLDDERTCDLLKNIAFGYTWRQKNIRTYLAS